MFSYLFIALRLFKHLLSFCFSCFSSSSYHITKAGLPFANRAEGGKPGQVWSQENEILWFFRSSEIMWVAVCEVGPLQLLARRPEAKANCNSLPKKCRTGWVYSSLYRMFLEWRNICIWLIYIMIHYVILYFCILLGKFHVFSFIPHAAEIACLNSIKWQGLTWVFPMKWWSQIT